MSSKWNEVPDKLIFYQMNNHFYWLFYQTWPPDPRKFMTKKCQTNEQIFSQLKTVNDQELLLALLKKEIPPTPPWNLHTDTHNFSRVLLKYIF